MTKSKKITLAIAAVVIIALLIVAGVTKGENIAGSAWSLFPPVVAIGLALITKEVYSSLFIGVLTGALLATNFSFTGTMDAVINDGLVAAVADNAGIFIFLVELGIIVALVNHAGAAEAHGAHVAVAQGQRLIPGSGALPVPKLMIVYTHGETSHYTACFIVPYPATCTQ